VTAAMVEPDLGWDYLVDAWLTLDVPEGWRAEVHGGAIELVPPPTMGHNLIAAEVHRALVGCLPADCGVFQTLGVHIAPQEKLYIPDLVVMDLEFLAAVQQRDDNYPVDAGEALLVAEITSKSTAAQDRSDKLQGYAFAGVPLYLLIDRFDRPGPTMTLFSEPEDGGYKRSVRVPFGDSIKLPEPFVTELHTSTFPH
jgi:Uma2 family endonuclease